MNNNAPDGVTEASRDIAARDRSITRVEPPQREMHHPQAKREMPTA